MSWGQIEGPAGNYLPGVLLGSTRPAPDLTNVGCSSRTLAFPEPLFRLDAIVIARWSVSTYKITVDRPAAPAYKGTFQFEDADVPSSKFTADCYWNPDKRIPQGVYEKCSLTTMATKKRDGVYLPNVNGFTGVFLHKGESLPGISAVKTWSDGCILLEPSMMSKLALSIAPRDGYNVTVTVND